jgi:hypothetical protein
MRQLSWGTQGIGHGRIIYGSNRVERKASSSQTGYVRLQAGSFHGEKFTLRVESNVNVI